jgi:hypothetical protein
VEQSEPDHGATLPVIPGTSAAAAVRLTAGPSNDDADLVMRRGGNAESSCFGVGDTGVPLVRVEGRRAAPDTPRL